MDQEIEPEKLKIEQLRLESEIRHRDEQLKLEAERLDIDRQRLVLDDKERKRAVFKNPLVLGVLAAFIGLMSNALLARINANKEFVLADARATADRNQQAQKSTADRTLEREKAESARILEALKLGGSSSKAIENLTLLTKAKLIPTFEEGLNLYLANLEERRIESGDPNLGPGSIRVRTHNQ